MGLYLLNVSVDTADPYPEYIPEDLSFNDQESIIEIIVEQVLGYDNAFKEYDDHDTEDHNKKNVKVDLLVDITIISEKVNQLPTEPEILHPLYKARLASGFVEIDSPPPKC